jgi:hypothetical protein
MRRNRSETKKPRSDSEEVLEVDLPVELLDRLLRFCDRTGFDMDTVITFAVESRLDADPLAGTQPKERLQ